jgi:hypothetical protein
MNVILVLMCTSVMRLWKGYVTSAAVLHICSLTSRVRLFINCNDSDNWIARLFTHMPDNIRSRAQQRLDVFFQLHPDGVDSPVGDFKGVILHCHTWVCHAPSVCPSFHFDPLTADQDLLSRDLVIQEVLCQMLSTLRCWSVQKRQTSCFTFGLLATLLIEKTIHVTPMLSKIFLRSPCSGLHSK